MERAVVSGTVKWLGAPLNEGRIRVVPEPGTDAPRNAGEIVNGRYTINSKGGVPVGTYRVEITAYEIIVVPPQPGDTEIVEIREQYLPKRYNTRTELVLTVPPGAQQVTQDFDLKK